MVGLPELMFMLETLMLMDLMLSSKPGGKQRFMDSELHGLHLEIVDDE